MAYNTYNSYNGDGVTTDFAIPFTYTDPSEVSVTRYNGSVTYTFLNSALIRINAPLASGDVLFVKRVTSLTTPKVVWQPGNDVTGAELNKVVTQVVNGLQEAKEQPGVKGDQGIQGIQGGIGPAGPVGPGWNQWKGVWSSATAYVINDAVQYNGSSYIAIVAGTNKQPDTQTAYWNLVAAKGTTGASGAGTGDMLKATYDSNNNGVVDTAEAVPWTGVTGKPTFATVATTGAYADLTGKPNLGSASALDVGTTASKVVQLDGNAKLPAIDGSQLINLPASGNPTGMVLTTAQNTAPSGYLAGDSVYLTSSYTALQAMLGSNFPDTVSPGTGVAMPVNSSGGGAAYNFMLANGTIISLSAVGTGNKSTDFGATWATNGNGPAFNVSGASYVGNRIVVSNLTGTGGSTKYSTDNGLTWNAGSSQPIGNMASNGSIIVGQAWVSGNPVNNLMTTTDGVTWTSRITIPGLTNPTISIIGGPYGFYAYGDDGTNAYTYKSSDGITWNQCGAPSGTGMKMLAASDDGKYVALCGASAGNISIFRSADGGATFAPSYFGYTAVGVLYGAFINGRWIVHDSGTTGTLVTLTAWEGIGALTWTKRTSSALSPAPTTTVMGSFYLRASAGVWYSFRLGVNGATCYSYKINDKSYNQATQFYIPPLNLSNPDGWTYRYIKS